VQRSLGSCGVEVTALSSYFTTSKRWLGRRLSSECLIVRLNFLPAALLIESSN